MDIKQKQIWTKEQGIVLHTLAESVARPGCMFLEIGSWCGDSSIIVGKVAQKNDGRLFCVDWWKGNLGTDLMDVASKEDVFSFFWERICEEGLEDVVVPIRSRSDVASEVLQKHLFDLVFVDADHRYESVLGDIQRYAHMVRKDKGILCGHDCEGYIPDYDMEFLEAGKDVDYYESVHCGVVLAVGSTFDNYSITHSIWSVQANKNTKDWEPTDLVLSEIDYKRQAPPPPIWVSDNYSVFRFGRLLFGVPNLMNPIDITNEETRNHPDVLTARSMSEIESLIGEKVCADSTPRLVESYKCFNLVKYKNRIFALDQNLGPVDLTTLEKRLVTQYVEQQKYVTADSLEGAKQLVDLLVPCRQMKNELSESERGLGGLSDQLAEKNQEIESLMNNAGEQGKQLVALSDQLAEKNQEIESLMNNAGEQGKQLVALSDQLAEKNQEIESLMNNAGEQGKQLVALSDQLAEKNQEIESLMNNAGEQEKQLVALSDQLAEKNQELDSLKSAFSKVHTKMEFFQKATLEREAKVQLFRYKKNSN